MSYRFRTEPQRLKFPVELHKSWLPFLRAMSQYVAPTDILTDGKLLFDAIRKGKFHLARFILEASENDLANTIDIRGKTPLMVACTIKEQLRRTTTFQLLLDHGASVNLRDDHGRCVLSHACELKCNDVVDILIRHKNVDPDISDHKGNTPLIYCAIVGNDVGTDLLTRHFRRLGLRVDHANNEGFTALMMAAKHGNISCARILLQQGLASLLHRDRIRGYSAQDWLQVKGFTIDDIAPTESSIKSKARFVRALSIARLIIPRERLEEVIKMEEERAKHGSSQRSSENCIEPPIKRPQPHKRKEKISRQIAEMLDVSPKHLINTKPQISVITKETHTDRGSRLKKNSIVLLPPININGTDAMIRPRGPKISHGHCKTSAPRKREEFLKMKQATEGYLSNNEEDEDDDGDLTEVDLVCEDEVSCCTFEDHDDGNTDVSEVENVF